MRAFITNHLKKTSGARSLCLLAAALLGSGCGPSDFTPVEGQASLKGNCTVSMHTSPGKGLLPIGTNVALTAVGSCHNGTPEYHFSVRNPAGGWSTLQAWGSTTTVS